MNTINKIMMAAGCGAMILGGGAMASPILIGNIDTFETSSSIPNQSTWGDTTLQGASVVSSDVGLYQQITVTGSGPFVGGGRVTTADSDFVGNYSLVNGGFVQISFDLTPSVSGNYPSQLALYFHSTVGGGSGQDWKYDFGTISGTHFTAVIGTWSSNWVSFDTTPNSMSFLAAMAGGLMSSIGIELYGKTTGADVYQFDNFKIEAQVPEPETVWMLVMVLASLAVTFRGRIKDVLSTIKI